MKKYNIFCPEIVPMSNKGEEAIIQGMIDTLFPERNCRFHVCDWDIDEPYETNNIVVHPAKYFFSKWRSQEFRLGISPSDIYSASSSILRNLLNRIAPSWVKWPHSQTRFVIKSISSRSFPYDGFPAPESIDYIIAGHNGGLDEYVCHLIDAYRSFGIQTSIYGSSMKPNVKNAHIIKIFEKTLINCNHVITRNPIAYSWANHHFPSVAIENAPDPAFGMRPSSEEEVTQFIESNGIGPFFTKPVIMITTAEPTPISRNSFDQIRSPYKKIEAHRDLLSHLLKHIIELNKFNVLFLPHTLGRDLIIANDVVKRSGLSDHGSVKVLEMDLPAKLLKGLIGKANFLIAERIHSMIGAVGVNTPFLCLGSNKDLRVKGIISEMLDWDNQIFLLNNPTKIGIVESFTNCISNQKELKKKLKVKNDDFQQILVDTGNKIREVINSKTSIPT
jgi:polysaccharide pyruvyl transferase WcaK-like protein